MSGSPRSLRAALFGPRARPVWVPVLAVGLSLGICFLAIAATGRDPVAGYLGMLEGGMGSLRAVGDSSVKVAVLLLTGLSVAMAFNVGIFNIGAEGQLVLGAIAAAWLGAAFHPGTAWLHLPVALGGAMVAGAAWALIPAWLKVRRGVHEVISTIMLNWVAIHLVESWLVLGPLAARSSDAQVSLPGTAQIDPTAELPRLFGPDNDLNLGLLLALAMALACAFVLRRTTLGFELRAIGASPEAARTAGIPVERRIVGAMAISGACAGLAGALLILGIHRQYPAVFHAGYGFDGIAMSLIGGNQPAGVLLAAAFFGVLRAGGTRLQLLQIHRTFPELIQGLALLFVAGQQVLRYLLAKAAGPAGEGDDARDR
jgi:general nucleoside transport system permease protein